MPNTNYDDDENTLFDNLAIYMLLNNVLEGDEIQEYRDELQKKSPKAYKEYLEFEKDLTDIRKK